MDRFGAAAAAAGDKMYAQIFVPDLAPSFLQRTQLYFADTYFGWSRSAVPNFGLIAQDSAKWQPF